MLNACSENRSDTLIKSFLYKALGSLLSFKSQDHTTHQSKNSLVDLQLRLCAGFYPAVSEPPSERAGLCVR